MDNVVDNLYGTSGTNDVLCSNHLVGSELGVSEPMELYDSSGSSASVNSGTTANSSQSSCGHTSHGTAWGSCTSYGLSAAPSDCSAMGLGN